MASTEVRVGQGVVCAVRRERAGQRTIARLEYARTGISSSLAAVASCPPIQLVTLLSTTLTRPKDMLKAPVVTSGRSKPVATCRESRVAAPSRASQRKP